jgi:hypothetical protein
MRRCLDIEREYKKVCAALDVLHEGASTRRCASGDKDLYIRLTSIKKTLEWIYPRLIKTKGIGRVRFSELMEHKHFEIGPTDDSFTDAKSQS